ncbi:MAG: class I mannose-6-phosphate isomerase [Lentisphaeria bacterium]|nr:class I mannose-6-phosphate isomerase [Lentisphaeria bacterium]MBR7119788.1 class I mannose-6-phosphate isomerase [Lentisphaeria bacterium]
MSGFVEYEQLYPLKFAPVYMERIWGGNQMAECLNRVLPEHTSPIGEAWEISDRPEADSVVTNGALAGKSLGELVKYYGKRLLGDDCREVGRFPLLVKIIDAGERLSLQVHPDSSACRELGEGAEPKTEMWYVISARPGAKILAGLSEKATRHHLRELITSPDVENLLQVYPSQPGDAYYIPSGTLHAIGAGNLILEVQQNSDTTYRISDWGRVDSNGKSRELHVEKGIKSVNFMNRKSPRIAGVVDKVRRNRKYDVVSLCPYFTVSDLRLVESRMDDTKSKSFHLLSGINSRFKVVCANGAGETVECGETVLVPAAVGSYRIEPMNDGNECVIVKTAL